MNKLKVAPGQRISRMSCGQRSQVALGLILAQNPELLVLDDFSLGLDPATAACLSTISATTPARKEKPSF